MDIVFLYGHGNGLENRLVIAARFPDVEYRRSEERYYRKTLRYYFCGRTFPNNKKVTHAHVKIYRITNWKDEENRLRSVNTIGETLWSKMYNVFTYIPNVDWSAYRYK